MTGYEPNRVQVEGSSPRADFLPPANRLKKEARKRRERLIRIVIAVLVLCAAAFGVTTFYASGVAGTLDASKARTDALIKELASYSGIVASVMEATEHLAIRAVVNSSDINAPSLARQITQSLPTGTSLTALSIIGQSALESPPAPSIVTGESSSTTVSVTIQARDLAGVEIFLLNARQWRGYSSATVTELVSGDNGIDATVTIYLNAEARDPLPSGSTSIPVIGSVIR